MNMRIMAQGSRVKAQSTGPLSRVWTYRAHEAASASDLRLRAAADGVRSRDPEVSTRHAAKIFHDRGEGRCSESHGKRRNAEAEEKDIANDDRKLLNYYSMQSMVALCSSDSNHLQQQRPCGMMIGSTDL